MYPFYWTHKPKANTSNESFSTAILRPRPLQSLFFGSGGQASQFFILFGTKGEFLKAFSRVAFLFFAAFALVCEFLLCVAALPVQIAATTDATRPGNSPDEIILSEGS